MEMLSRSRNADAKPARTRSDLVGSTREMSSKRRGFRLKLYISVFSSSAKKISNSERCECRYTPTLVALTKQPPSHILCGFRVPPSQASERRGDPLVEGIIRAFREVWSSDCVSTQTSETSRVRIRELSCFPYTLGIRPRDRGVSGLPRGHYCGHALSRSHDSHLNRGYV